MSGFSPSSNLPKPYFEPMSKIIRISSSSESIQTMAREFGYLGVRPRDILDTTNQFLQILNSKRCHVFVKYTFTATRSYTLEEVPPTTSLIIEQLHHQKVEESESNNAKKMKDPDIKSRGNLTFDQIISIAQNKKASKTARTLTAKVKEVLGTCQSVGCTVNGEHPRDIFKLIDSGILIIP